MADPLGTDLRLAIGYSEEVDFVVSASDLETISGREDLVQALKLRLLVSRGELTELGHPRYGSRVRDLIGDPLDSANLELLRRYVRKTLLEDPRVEEVPQVEVRVRSDVVGMVEVDARVKPFTEEEFTLEVALEMG